MVWDFDVNNLELGTSFGNLSLEDLLVEPYGSSQGGRRKTSTPRTYIPAMDVFEKSTHIYVYLDLPGVLKNNVHINVTDRQLIVYGKRPGFPPSQVSADQAVWRERMTGKFRRKIALPDDIDSDKVEAKLNSGVLEVVLPIAETARMRKVNVQ
jgi:HSP20 family protein